MTAEITIWKYYIYLSWVARLMSYDQFHIGDLKSCILSYYTNIFHRILFFQIFLYNFFVTCVPSYVLAPVILSFFLFCCTLDTAFFLLGALFVLYISTVLINITWFPSAVVTSLTPITTIRSILLVSKNFCN